MGVTESVIGRGGAGRGLVCRLGAPDWGPIRGRSTIRLFGGIWGVCIWVELLTRHITGRGYTGGNWGQSQPSCTVKTLAPGSPAERVDTKDYVRDSKEDFHFCRDRKHWTVFVNTENAQRAAPARHKLSRITAASPHQRGETGKANCSAGGGNNIVFPKGWTFICTCRAAANCSKNRVSCSTAVNSQTDWL